LPRIDIDENLAAQNRDSARKFNENSTFSFGQILKCKIARDQGVNPRNQGI